MATLENPTLEFLLYLVERCLVQCQVDPDKTTVTEFINNIKKERAPLGF